MSVDKNSSGFLWVLTKIPISTWSLNSPLIYLHKIDHDLFIMYKLKNWCLTKPRIISLEISPTTISFPANYPNWKLNKFTDLMLCDSSGYLDVLIFWTFNISVILDRGKISLSYWMNFISFNGLTGKLLCFQCKSQQDVNQNSIFTSL